jgi:hypothetical protein
MWRHSFQLRPTIISFLAETPFLSTPSYNHFLPRGDSIPCNSVLQPLPSSRRLHSFQLRPTITSFPWRLHSFAPLQQSLLDFDTIENPIYSLVVNMSSSLENIYIPMFLKKRHVSLVSVSNTRSAIGTQNIENGGLALDFRVYYFEAEIRFDCLRHAPTLLLAQGQREESLFHIATVCRPQRRHHHDETPAVLRCYRE